MGITGCPAQELKWYDAYNAVKHNREGEFGRAMLRHAFDAVTACAIMMGAQFGLPVGIGQRSELQAFFHFWGAPDWPPSEVYIYPYGEHAVGWSRSRMPSRGPAVGCNGSYPSLSAATARR